MNKAIKFLLFCLFSFLIMSCSPVASKSNSKDIVEEETEVVSKGSAVVKLFVPDYVAMAKDRAVAPQTEKVCFSYYKDDFWHVLPTSSLSDFDSEEPKKGLKGRIYNIKVDGIPVGKYSEKEIKVQLRDSYNVVITEGTNSVAVEIVDSSKNNNSTPVSFYTIPVDYDNQNGSLKKGEMKFWKVTAKANRNYTITTYAYKKYLGFMDSPSNPYPYDSYKVDYNSEAFPDIVIFNDDGSFNHYYPLTADENQVMLEQAPYDREFYIGVWAESGDVYVYSLSFAADDGVNSDWTGGFELIDGGFGPEWNAFHNSSFLGLGISETDDVLSGPIGEKNVTANFRLESLHDGVAVLSRTVLLAEDSILSFSYWGDACQLYNGIVEFYVDDVKKKVFESKQVVWKELSVQLPAGRHTIKWVAKGRSVYSALNRLGEYWVTNVNITKEYIPEPEPEIPTDDTKVTIGNKVYNGYISSTGKQLGNTNYATFDFAEGVPDRTTIIADGFFRLKGTVNTDSLYVHITKLNETDNHYTYYIFDKGDFDENIWLRFGKGDYRITICDADVKRLGTPDDNYVYDVNDIASASDAVIITLTVTNTAEDSIEDAMWTMPSYYCQSNSGLVKAYTDMIMKDLSSDASDRDKLKAIHDWIIHRTDYDMESLVDADNDGYPDHRKAQDAISVINYKLGVCEGYTNLFIAMARYLGFKAKFVSSSAMGHAWVNVFVDGEWKLVDVTWDDPVDENGNGGYYSDQYFLVGLDGINNNHYDYSDDYENFECAARTADIQNNNRLPGWY